MKLQREFEAMYEKVFAQFGVTHYAFTRSKKHAAVEFILPTTGQRRKLTFSSQGDGRALLNHRADVKRYLLKNGLNPSHA